METTDVPYSWLKAVDPKVAEVDTVPLFGKAPTFPWEEFSSILGDALQIQELKIEPSKVLWRSEEELLSGFGDDAHIQEVTLPDLEESCFLLLAGSDWTKIASWLIQEIPPVSLDQFDPEVVQALKTFVFTTVLLKFGEISFDPTLALHLNKESNLRMEPALSVDILVTTNGTPLTARLLLSSRFLEGWKKRFENQKMEIPVQTELLKKLSVVLHLEMAKELLSKDELDSLQVGDILLLKDLTVDPSTYSGTIQMTYNGIPRFKGTLSDGVLNVNECVSAFEQLTPLQKPAQPSSGEQETDG